jgi:hypothetical protein
MPFRKIAGACAALLYAKAFAGSIAATHRVRGTLIGYWTLVGWGVSPRSAPPHDNQSIWDSDQFVIAAAFVKALEEWLIRRAVQHQFWPASPLPHFPAKSDRRRSPMPWDKITGRPLKSSRRCTRPKRHYVARMNDDKVHGQGEGIKIRLLGRRSPSRNTPLLGCVGGCKRLSGDYIVRLLERTVAYLELRWAVGRSSSLRIPKSFRGQDRILEISRLGARRYVDAPGGLALYDREAFAKFGVELSLMVDGLDSQTHHASSAPNLLANTRGKQHNRG